MRSQVRLALAVVVGALGCAHFRPVTPLRAQSGDLEMELTSVIVGNFGALVFAAQSTQAHALTRAWFTVATRSPCTGGEDLGDVRIDGKRATWLPAGSHQIALWPSSGALSFGLDTVVDIQTEAGCVRVPAVSQSVALVPAARPSVIVNQEALFTPMPVGSTGLLGIQLGVGQWVGPVQLIAAAGYAVASCHKMTCGQDALGENLRSGSAIPLSIEARTALGTLTLRQHVTVAFLEASYTLAPVWLPAVAGEQRYTAQSAFAALAWGLAELPPGPFRHPERAAIMELSIPLGVTVQTGPGGRHTAFSGGLALRFILPL